MKCFPAVLLLPVLAALAAAPPALAQERQALATGWLMQSSDKAGTDGARISSPGFRPKGWYAVTVPTTVAGALVEAGVYKDPFFALNLRALPGMTYPIGANFVHTAMAPGSPFIVPWWFRRVFSLPASMKGRRIALRFDGINYRANIWLNGKRLADSTQVAGTFRRYELDVTDALRKSGDNILAVEVFSSTPADLDITWVDWNPSPPDKNMGLWQDVWLVSSRDVTVRHPQVIARVDTATLRSADLTVAAELRNLSANAVTGTLKGRIGDVAFNRTIALPAHDGRTVLFTVDSFPQLRFQNPRLWWPAELGKPELYDLELSFEVNGVVSDRQRLRFGIRQVTGDLATPRGALLLRVNGKRIVVRGGGWAPDLFLRHQPARQDAQLRYALDLHLNAIRLEGNYEDDRFWQRTDSLGILVMSGWVCCSAWEEWKKWGPEQLAVAEASQRDQIRRLRGHASALLWLNGSDMPPPADVEKMYIAVLQQERWPNPYVSSASAKPAQATGPSGVKMTGPYDWVPPGYWLQDTLRGGGWGYNTETSPGAAVPPIESIRLMMPERDVRWPLDSVWLYHAAGGQFKNLLDRFNTALAARYGPPADVEDYTFKSQLMTYEGERAMFEAYRRNKYVSTGIIQWMFNNAWPSIYWHLFDWYLRPAGGYFGSKKANEPVHAMFSYDDRSVAVVSALRTPLAHVRLRARALAPDGAETFSRDTFIDLPADTSLRLFRIPEPGGFQGAYLVDLRLNDSQGKPLSSNLYWLSTKPDVLQLDSSTWYTTPVKAFADFTSLKSMPRVALTPVARFSSRAGTGEARVTLANPGRNIAFFVRLQVQGAKGQEALPVLWEDNYITLLPGETRELRASYALKDLKGGRPRVVVQGWNVPRAESK